MGLNAQDPDRGGAVEDIDSAPFGTTDEEGRDRRRDAIGPAGVMQANSLMLCVRGIGEDRFWINEFIDNKTMASFTTVADYDRNNHAFQEKCIQEETPGYTPKPWRGRIFGDWVRFMLDGSMVYGSLNTLAAYLYTTADDAGSEHVSTLVPSRFVDGPNNGRRHEGMVEMDLVTVADGAEDIEFALSMMRHRWLNDLYQDLLDRFQSEQTCHAWILEDDGSEDHDPMARVIFSDTSALDAVRLRSFVRDVRAIAGPEETPAILEKEVVTAHIARIDALHDALRAGDWSGVDEKIREQARHAFKRARDAEARGAKPSSLFSL